MSLEGYMLVKQAAVELGVTVQQVRQLVRAGRLRAECPSPRLYLVDRASIEAYKRERRPPGRPSAATDPRASRG